MTVMDSDTSSAPASSVESGAPTGPKPRLEDEYGIRAHWKALAACTLVSMCPFQYGIDFGIIGGLQAMIGFLEVFGYPAPNTAIGWNISTERQQLISSLMTLGAFISSSLAGPIASHISRKLTIWIACALCIIANAVMMTTNSIIVLYVARTLLGLANGLFMTFSQLYIQETSPARYRGLMISSFMVWTSVGTLVGTIVDNFTAELPGRQCYVVPLGLIFIVPGLLFGALFVVPESPRWLAQYGHIDAARKSLRILRPYTEEGCEAELRDIQDALTSDLEHSKSVAIMDMFNNPVDCRRTILSICALTTQGGCGAMYMIAYGTYFFEMAGIGNAFANSCILVTLGVVAILINSAVVTHFGRRRVFLISGQLLCGLSQLLTALIYTFSPGTQATGKAIVVLAVIYILGYNGMVSTYAWISGGELPSQRLRSYTFGLATAIGFLAAWITTFTAPYFINPDSLNWGPKYGYIWTPSCVVCALWVYFFLPEVKGRTLEEIDEMFEARLPARKFRKYVCVGRSMASDPFIADSTSKTHIERTENIV